MVRFFSKLGAFFGCHDSRVVRERNTSSLKQAANKPTQKRQEHISRSNSRLNVQIPLEYVPRDADTPNDGPERQILGRKSSYSVGSSLNDQPAESLPPGTLLAEHITPTEATPTDSQDVGMQPVAPLLGPQKPEFVGRKCLVLDLDETLVHSSFKFLPDADFVIPVDIEGRKHNVYVIKRPGVDEFLEAVGELFEVVVFTASVSKYGHPLLDHLDHKNVIHHRLFRECCYNFNGNYIKNLSQLGRPLEQVIIIDNSPASYALQPQHAVPVSTWFSDIHDNELMGMLPFLTDLAGSKVNDVSAILNVSTVVPTATPVP